MSNRVLSLPLCLSAKTILIDTNRTDLFRLAKLCNLPVATNLGPAPNIGLGQLGVIATVLQVRRQLFGLATRAQGQ
jgi:hypothetical protein